MEDFPAAHSMDSTWFAIDRDGHVAIFETGEAGCMPLEGYGEQGMLHEDEIRALPATGMKFDLAGHRIMHGSDHVQMDPERPHEYTILVFVHDLEAVRDLLPKLNAKELPATRGACLAIHSPDLAAFAQLHERDACAGCHHTWRDPGENDFGYAKYGLYQYDHTCENWISGPYARTTVPVQPISVDKLPSEIKERASRFDGRFADRIEIQPAEHWECGGWEPAWLASDRKTVRPFADRADEYAEAVENLQDIEGGLVFAESPGGGGEDDEDEADADDNDAPVLEREVESPAPAAPRPWWKFW